MQTELTLQKKKQKLIEMLSGPKLSSEPWLEELDRDAFINRSFDNSMPYSKPPLQALSRPIMGAIDESSIDLELPPMDPDEERQPQEVKRVLKRRNSVSYLTPEPPLISKSEIQSQLKNRQKNKRRFGYSFRREHWGISFGRLRRRLS